MAELQQAFAADLDLVRQTAGLSIAELAKLVNEPANTLRQLLKGELKKPPPWDRVAAVVNACAAKVDVNAPEEVRRLTDLTWWRAKHADLVRHVETVRPKERPTRVVRLPVTSDLFVGRVDELDSLATALDEKGRAVVVAVHGLGGVGKSTLAARYAAEHAHRFDLVWWVTADSPESLASGLADLAAAVAPGATALDERVEAAIRWLSTHRDWLVVLDNLTSPAIAASLLSRVRSGKILVTSRQSTGWRGVATVPLPVLAPAEAEDLLSRTVLAEWAGADLDGASRLCEELGWLPLAVEQAGAYIGQTRITPAKYVDLLARYPARLFSATEEGGDGQRTMARIWHVTLDRLTDTPLAGDLLRQLAWCAPNAVPRWLWHDDLDVLEALRRLAAYSMITLTADAISVHRLVQAVSRTPDPTDPHRQPNDIQAARTTVTTVLAKGLEEKSPQIPSSWPACRAVLPHARSLLTRVAPRHDTMDSRQLFDHIGLFLRGQGYLTSAIAFLERALSAARRMGGDDDIATLASRNNLAGTYNSLGDLERARSMYEALLADSERLLGTLHPQTLTCKGNLANTYMVIGDQQRAIPLHLETLRGREQELGPDHPDTLTCRSNLASSYESVGDVQQAISLYEDVLADRRRVLGPDHPDTLKSRHKLANAHANAGDLTRAAALHNDILIDHERELGPDHPDTLASRASLADAYLSAGKTDLAITLYEQIVADRVRVSGPITPDTLDCRRDLASAYRTAGRHAEALRIHLAVVADYESTLGTEHLNTLIAYDALATTYLAAGDLAKALPLLETTAAAIDRVSGPTHPNTLAIRTRLGNLYIGMGDMARAIPLTEDLVADCERVLGNDHLLTIQSLGNLAGLYEMRGDVARAVPLHLSALTGAERVLGSDHPTTLTLRNNVANACETVGDLPLAISLHESTLADRERVLGTDNLSVLSSRNNLGNAYRSAGRLAEARAMLTKVVDDRRRLLGPDHPDTLISRSNLAAVDFADGDFDRAVTACEGVLSDRIRILGPDHYDTLTSMAQLAGALAMTGKPDEALTLYDNAVAGFERVFGPDHPLTVAVRANRAALGQ